MSDISIIDPYDSYDMLPLGSVEENYGTNLLNRVGSLQVGFGSKVLRVDQDGLWMGAEDFASAPFSVDMDGNITATSLDLSNYLQVGEALDDIGLLGITEGYIAANAITSTKIQDGAITTGKIFAGSVTATKISVSQLSGISADLGTINAGSITGVTITGGTIQTSVTGARVVISGASDNITIYDASVRRMMLDNDELTFYDSGGNQTSTLHSNGNALDADVGTDGFFTVNFNNNSTISGLSVEELAGTVVFYMGGASNTDVGYIGVNSVANSLIPEDDLVDDLGNSSSSWDNCYVDDIFLNDDIIMSGGTSGNINGIGDLFLLGQTSSPTATGQLRYYSSGGTYGLRMRIPGFTLQFQADIV